MKLRSFAAFIFVVLLWSSPPVHGAQAVRLTDSGKPSVYLVLDDSPDALNRSAADELTLSQLAIVPIRSRGGSGTVQLYAALEVLVRTSSGASEKADAADAAL